MPLAASFRNALRIVAIASAALVLGAAAYEFSPTTALSAGPHPTELVGTYRMEPEDLADATTSMGFLHLASDGVAHIQLVTLSDSAGILSAVASAPPKYSIRWSVERPEGGTFAALFRHPRLCLDTRGSSSCTPFARDAATGHLEQRGEPALIRNGVEQRFVKLRMRAARD